LSTSTYPLNGRESLKDWIFNPGLWPFQGEDWDRDSLRSVAESNGTDRLYNSNNNPGRKNIIT
jgi:hypothetical protein